MSAPRLPEPLIIVWALGTLALGTRLVLALSRLQSIARRSEPLPALVPETRVDPDVATPMTWGLRHPVIVLPEALLSRPEACESALRHERAHVERRDWAWHLLAEGICALYWFQPGAWWLRRCLRAESERACDDRVVLSGVSAADYASHLVEILQTRRRAALAPGMANAGPLEMRVRQILDPTRPRRTTAARLGLVSLAMVALVPAAALRVSARETEPPAPTASPASRPKPPATAHRPRPDARASQPVPAAAPTAAGLAAPAAMPDIAAPRSTMEPNSPEPSPAPAEPPVPLDRVVWGTTVDGLQPGFLLVGASHIDRSLKPFDSAIAPDRVADNSLVTYRVLLRNATDRQITFFVRLLPYEGMDVPYLTPGNVGEDLSPEYRARPATRRQSVDPAYHVKLAPGESIFVPGRSGEDNVELFVGVGGPGPVPAVTVARPGMNWIVQPITVRIPPADDQTPYVALMGLYSLTRIDSKGVAKSELADRIHGLKEGKTLYARIQQEVGTRNAEAPRTARTATWGKVEKGLQCGIRLINPRDAYRIGDTLEAEVLWRNVSEKALPVAMAKASDLYPALHDTKGNYIDIDFGARLNLLPGYGTLTAGEVRSLGTVRLTIVAKGTPSPGSNLEPAHLRIGPGTYRLSSFGGVSIPGQGSPESGAIEFRVVAP